MVRLSYGKILGLQLSFGRQEAFHALLNPVRLIVSSSHFTLPANLKGNFSKPFDTKKCSFRSKLDMSKKKKKKKKHFTSPATIQHPDFGVFHTEISTTTIFGDLMQQFRQARKIPEELKLCFCDVSSWDPDILLKIFPVSEIWWWLEEISFGRERPSASID